jgi:hypothetical protein
MNDELKKLVEEAFDSFIVKHIGKYKSLSSGNSVNFTGSVAFVFSDILRDVCNRHQISVGRIEQSPLNGLISYHSKEER